MKLTFDIFGNLFDNDLTFEIFIRIYAVTITFSWEINLEYNGEKTVSIAQLLVQDFMKY